MAKFRIFYTDDDEDDQLLFSEIIRGINGGHQVSVQSHGAELMEMLKSDNSGPDIVFLDLNMPHKNGFEVLKEMRNDNRFMDLPVIVFSTSAHLETVERCRELGANGYICKPTSFPYMKKILEKVLNMDWGNTGSKMDFFHIDKH